jgi:hypothetical protein
MKSDQTEVCAICGEQKECTRDHIPPKGVFLKPRPKNLVTVPACHDCNNGSSQYDEKFKMYLALHVAMHSKKGEKFFKNALKTFRHNQKLRKQILGNIEPIEFKTPRGVSLGEGALVLWDSEAHDRIIERTIRGLYYHHYGKVLAKRADISVHWHKALPEGLQEFALDKNWMGEDEFIYLHSEAEDSPLSTLWIFQFYNSHWASGVTIAKKLQQSVSN